MRNLLQNFLLAFGTAADSCADFLDKRYYAKRDKKIEHLECACKQQDWAAARSAALSFDRQDLSFSEVTDALMTMIQSFSTEPPKQRIELMGTLVGLGASQCTHTQYISAPKTFKNTVKLYIDGLANENLGDDTNTLKYITDQTVWNNYAKECIKKNPNNQSTVELNARLRGFEPPSIQ